jgi:hypothetical protein
MKRIVLLCSILVLPGLNLMGQTNAAPTKTQSAQRSQEQGQKGASKLKSQEAPPLTQGSFRHSSEAQPWDLAVFQRVSRDGRLTPSEPKKDFGATLERIFRPDNDQMGETCIRDTVVTIFPTGR